MIEQGEDPPFGNESPLRLGRKQPSADQLDGDFPLKLAVIAAGAIDIAHSALADEFHDAVGAESSASRKRGVVRDSEEPPCRVMRRKKRRDFDANLRAQSGKEYAALNRRQVQSLAERFSDSRQSA
jgi:hypothetical protein